MPVFDRVYARMTDRPPAARTPRFLAIARYSARCVRKFKLFWFLVVASWIPAFIWIVTLYGAGETGRIEVLALEILERVPETEYRRFAADYALVFLQLQGLCVTFVAALAGGGAIAEDARRHALELYASRPIGGATYVLGKWFAVFTRLLVVLLYPTLAVVAVAFGFLPRCFETCWPVGVRTAAAAVFMAACYAIVVLGVSASVRSTRYAVVFWFILAFFTMVASLILVRVTGESAFEAVSFRFGIEHVSSWILGADLAAVPFVDASDRSLLLSGGALSAWIAGALLLLRRRLVADRSA